MNKTKFKVRHISCNLKDFNLDRHRFRYEYNGNEYIVSLIGNVTVIFNDDNIPDNVKHEVTKIIYKKMDNNEFKKWRYPIEAYKTANEYCENTFC